MLCYLDRAFCLWTCGNLECNRNQDTIDIERFRRSGLPLSVCDLRTKTCGYRKPERSAERPAPYCKWACENRECAWNLVQLSRVEMIRLELNVERLDMRTASCGYVPAAEPLDAYGLGVVDETRGSMERDG